MNTEAEPWERPMLGDGVPEFSNPVVTRADDGHVTVAWGKHGWKQATIVSDVLIDEWIAEKNELVDLRAEVARLTTERAAMVNVDGLTDRLEATAEQLIARESIDMVDLVTLLREAKARISVQRHEVVGLVEMVDRLTTETEQLRAQVDRLKPRCSAWLSAVGSCRLAEGHTGPHRHGKDSWSLPGERAGGLLQDGDPTPGHEQGGAE